MVAWNPMQCIKNICLFRAVISIKQMKENDSRLSLSLPLSPPFSGFGPVFLCLCKHLKTMYIMRRIQVARSLKGISTVILKYLIKRVIFSLIWNGPTCQACKTRYLLDVCIFFFARRMCVFVCMRWKCAQGLKMCVVWSYSTSNAKQQVQMNMWTLLNCILKLENLTRQWRCTSSRRTSSQIRHE